MSQKSSKKAPTTCGTAAEGSLDFFFFFEIPEGYRFRVNRTQQTGHLSYEHTWQMCSLQISLYLYHKKKKMTYCCMHTAVLTIVSNAYHMSGYCCCTAPVNIYSGASGTAVLGCSSRDSNISRYSSTAVDRLQAPGAYAIRRVVTGVLTAVVRTPTRVQHSRQEYSSIVKKTKIDKERRERALSH